jgi:hypothetical protein
VSEGKVSAGQDFYPPPAQIWNNMIDAGRAWADQRFSNGTPEPTRPRQTDLIKLKNTSGALRKKGEILKIDGKAIEDITSESIWLLGVQPTADCYFGILKRPAENNGIEDVHVSGVCTALVNIANVDHTRADVVAGDYVLGSSDSGPIEILYAPDLAEGQEYPQELECVVRFGAVSGDGTPTILFQIIRVLRGVGLNCNAMECEVLNASCGSGVSAGDLVTVYDEMGCVFNSPEYLLYGRRGYAIQMKNFAYRMHDPLIFEPGTEDIAAPTGSCRWAAQNLCCVEEDS